MERAFFLIIAVSLAFGVGCMGRNRKIGFGWAFGLSLLNVFIGIGGSSSFKENSP